jgi:hypothetical protein
MQVKIIINLRQNYFMRKRVYDRGRGGEMPSALAMPSNGNCQGASLVFRFG